jgi:hypothetical protein
MPEKDVPLLIDHMDTTISSAASVIDLLSTCLVGSCDDFSSCKSSQCWKLKLVLNGTMLSYFSLGRCLYDVCDAVPDYQVNPDIDGPGPTYSYIIQITISLSVIIVIGMLSYLFRVPYTF